MMTTINACTSAVSGFCLVVLFTFCSKRRRKKKTFSFGKCHCLGVCLCFAIAIKGSFFPLISTDSRNYRAQNNVLYLFIPFISFGLFSFLFFLMGAVSFAGLQNGAIGEELLPYLTLRRCWMQSLKKRTDIKEARTDLIMGRATIFGNVLSNNNQSSTQTKQKSFKKTDWDFISFHIWPRSIPRGVFFLGCWERETVTKMLCCCDLLKP